MRRRQTKSPGKRRAGVAALLVIVVALAVAWNKQRVAGVEQEAAQVEAVRPSPERRANLERSMEAPHTVATASALGEREKKKPDDGRTIPPDATRDRPSREREARPTEPTARELRRLRRRAEAEFSEADTDSDGYLTRTEAADRIPFLAREFELVDVDRDGRISNQEFWRLSRRQAEHGVRP